MGYAVLAEAEAFWRPSNQMGVLNTDLAKQLGAATLGARLWRLRPGEASTRHRHRRQDELYVLLEGRGRVRIGHDLLTLEPLSAIYVEADEQLAKPGELHEKHQQSLKGKQLVNNAQTPTKI